MTEHRTCPVCETRPLDDTRHACKPCVDNFRTQLHDLPDRMDAVTDAIGNRLNFRGTYREGGKSSDRPLPINTTASDNAYVARTTLLTWTDHIAHARGEATPDTWATIQHFLDVRAGWLAAQHDGPEAITEILYALNVINRTIDRPTPTHYAGPCTSTTTDTDGLATDCDGELYARPGHATVKCPRCGTEYNTYDRREWLLAEAWDAIAPGPDIVRALAGSAFGGLTVSLSTLRTWAADGKLEKVDVINGRPRYRVGDIINLATGTHTTTTRPERIAR